MSYNMFIDDERFPPANNQQWKICRSFDQVKEVIKEHGFPKHISFDHDLGDQQPTGYDIAKWMVECDLDQRVIPDDLSFYVHSQNPIGKRNIEALLINYLDHRRCIDHNSIC